MDLLTDLQERFIEEYFANSFQPMPAYLASHPDCNSEKAARVNASRLLKNPKILEAMEILEGDYKRIAREKGIDRHQVAKRLADIINGKQKIVIKTKKLLAGKIVTNEKLVEIDNAPKDVVAAINTLAKLIGDFSPEEHKLEWKDGTTPDFSKMSDEEKLEYKKKLLAEL